MTLSKKDLIPDDFNYNDYVKEHGINILLEDKKKKDYSKKIEKTITYDVDPENRAPCLIEYDDLVRLHHIVCSRKALTVLEFGVGKSTIVIGDALHKNKIKDLEYAESNLRRQNKYEIHSIDNIKKYIGITKREVPKSLCDSNICKFHSSSVIIGTFAGKVCTFYTKIPNICPDIIYLDGPNQFSPKGSIRGISTRHQDRMPMAGDILSIEHFLQPSTLIIVDGRGANARFLQTNLQRNWAYYYSKEWDQHFFELQEAPLGKYNETMIDYCIGREYYLRSDIVR